MDRIDPTVKDPARPDREVLSITGALSGTVARQSCAVCASAAKLSWLRNRIQRGDADMQMLGDRALVEGARGTRQLDFAVQGFIRDAQQGAVGDPQAVALERQRLPLSISTAMALA